MRNKSFCNNNVFYIIWMLTSPTLSQTSFLNRFSENYHADPLLEIVKSSYAFNLIMDLYGSWQCLYIICVVKQILVL